MSKIAKIECEECSGLGYCYRIFPGHEECGCGDNVPCSYCHGNGYIKVILEDNNTWHYQHEND